MEKEIEKIIEEYRQYAEEKGIGLNDNHEMLEGLAKRLIENEKKYGARYCPCRVVKGKPEIDQKNICPCSYSEEEIEKSGHCLCWLFVKK
ncbi:MAG: ferredoxin-thioredoxin reductase catalytic domain-containing protein [Candidatus Paceibacterota bacterium]|jgi:ferredoxin-thioredoxin reductase catalytic subunit|nr:ferredoxin-thioredoxin reductase catalytic domain-containing protein [Candidatus Paceibacterota bacterium]MDD4831081.1 ferredoxin-thioredoxin reductase catalytic domain-containing protein [Candidatus Paceibacterota bacterium]MDD4875035.1 ferredoxin-thioredoxin reductase catalytic domain-containing protein [Candidatus Paceibacterota bacterium]